ncbi:hypothetical protein FGB62_181g010 [Gracilaria domingensis]|nr:hypothetical protein FGB62_181g010 [Gracilaria domingensis]
MWKCERCNFATTSRLLVLKHQKSCITPLNVLQQIGCASGDPDYAPSLAQGSTVECIGPSTPIEDDSEFGSQSGTWTAYNANESTIHFSQSPHIATESSLRTCIDRSQRVTVSMNQDSFDDGRSNTINNIESALQLPTNSFTTSAPQNRIEGMWDSILVRPSNQTGNNQFQSDFALLVNEDNEASVQANLGSRLNFPSLLRLLQAPLGSHECQDTPAHAFVGNDESDVEVAPDEDIDLLDIDEIWNHGLRGYYDVAQEVFRFFSCFEDEVRKLYWSFRPPKDERNTFHPQFRSVAQRCIAMRKSSPQIEEIYELVRESLVGVIGQSAYTASERLRQYPTPAEFAQRLVLERKVLTREQGWKSAHISSAEYEGL